MSSASVSPSHPPLPSFFPKVINCSFNNKPVSKCVPIQPDHKFIDNWFNGNKTSINLIRPM